MTFLGTCFKESEVLTFMKRSRLWIHLFLLLVVSSYVARRETVLNRCLSHVPTRGARTDRAIVDSSLGGKFQFASDGYRVIEADFLDDCLGLRDGDLVLAINGTVPHDPYSYLAGFEVDQDPICLTIQRQGHVVELRLPRNEVKRRLGRSKDELRRTISATGALARPLSRGARQRRGT